MGYWDIDDVYPLVNKHFAIEHGDFPSGFTHYNSMVMNSYSYVKVYQAEYLMELDWNQWLNPTEKLDIGFVYLQTWAWLPIGSMYGIYGNIYHQYTPFMLAYIPAPWILWVRHEHTFGILSGLRNSRNNISRCFWRCFWFIIVIFRIIIVHHHHPHHHNNKEIYIYI